jgi:hypothetical protein
MWKSPIFAFSSMIAKSELTMISKPPAVAYPSITETEGFGDLKIASQIRADRAAISYACDVPMNSPFELVEVEPGAERALAAPDHHDTDVVVLLGPLPRPIQLVQQLLADRVALVRAVEPDPRDVPVDLVLDRLGFDDRHDGLLGCWGSTSLSCGDAA